MARHPTPIRFDGAEPGDLVWCRFPEDSRLRPAPKPRPVLILAVGHPENDASMPMVRVAAGTSRKTDAGQVYPWEFVVERDGSGPFHVSGLSYTTKFNLRNTLELPYTSDYFAPPPNHPFGKTPKLGVLHATYVAGLKRAASAA